MALTIKKHRTNLPRTKQPRVLMEKYTLKHSENYLNFTKKSFSIAEGTFTAAD